jgi:hypothetical protein
MIGRRELGQWSLAVVALTLGMLPLVGCSGDAFPDYHYKMTIYAGGKAFSSVRGIAQEEVSSMVDSAGRRVERTLSGEAVIIDLDGRTYYALLSKPDNADYATLITGAALAPYIPGAAPQTDAEKAVGEVREDARRTADPGYYLDDMAERSRAMTQVVGPKDLPRTLPPRNGKPPFEAWPMFVTFGDPKDPKTVRAVSPEEIGVSKITIEITDEPVTTGIEGRFSWWTQFGNKHFDGTSTIMEDMTASSLAAHMSSGSFSTEFKQ